MNIEKDIILTTINAKWIHPSLALRLLKANLGSLEEKCEIIEFALRQPLSEKTQPLLAAKPRVLGFSVSVWNHTQTIELLEELNRTWTEKAIVVLGGPEVSYLPSDAKIFEFADFIIRGEGETVFRLLCEDILLNENNFPRPIKKEITGDKRIDPCKIKFAYHLYTDEDITKKLIYVESYRGCPFKCEFCQSAIDNKMIEFPLEPFLTEMEKLIKRGTSNEVSRSVKTFKFLDRSFNVNITRAVKIMEFFLEKINSGVSFVVHFEMVPSIFPPQLRDTLTRFPAGTLRLEIGIQSLNAEVNARIGRPSNPEKEIEALKFLREKTNAVVHADLIAGLPGEDMASFGRGFDLLRQALSAPLEKNQAPHVEIQLGILKLLPGVPIIRHNEEFNMCYNPLPPYEVIETSSINACDIRRIKNFARFWELLVNRRLIKLPENEPVFDQFMEMSDSLFAHFGRNWGIDKAELTEKLVTTAWTSHFTYIIL